jgi:hypothetical protein
MKTNFTPFRYAVLLTIAILGFVLPTKADNPGYGFTFNQVPQLVSGSPLAVGAKYKFQNVASGYDAFVTIMSATGGAYVTILDDNTLTKPEAFSPTIHVSALSTGMVEFKIEFVNGGGNLKTVDTLVTTAMDIDGNTLLHEVDMLDMGPSSILSYLTGTLQINVVPTLTQYLATNLAGIEYDGIDTTAKQVMFTLKKTNISSFTYKAGAINLGGATTRQKAIYFKGFNYVAPNGTLAVKYTSFDATVANKSVLLNWITEQEFNHNYFEVERSFDGRTFSAIALVLDGFENGTKKSYQFKDNAAELQTRSVIYYRLKQVDKDGKTTYTNTLVVKMKAANDITIQASPNPFIENLNVRFTAAENGKAEISLVNGNGQQIATRQSNITKGYITLQIDGLAKLAPGMYIATVKINGVVLKRSLKTNYNQAQRRFTGVARFYPKPATSFTSTNCLIFKLIITKHRRFIGVARFYSKPATSFT